MIGVYKITNLVDGKVYVGSTAMTFEERWSVHRSSLRCGRHANKHLQRAWNKYGEQSFSFEVIEVVADPSKVRDAERKWISKYFGENCYNTSMEGAGRPTKVARYAIRECLERAFASGVTTSKGLMECLRESFGSDVSDKTMVKVLYDMGYESSPRWELQKGQTK